MTEAARDLETEMRSAVAAGDYAKAGEIGKAAGFSADLIPVVIVNIEIELGRAENAKKIWPGLQPAAEEKVDVKPEAAKGFRRRDAEIAAHLREEAQNDAVFQEWIAEAKRKYDAAREAQAKAEREHNPAADPGALPSAVPEEEEEEIPLHAGPKTMVAALNKKFCGIRDYGGKFQVMSWVPWDVDESILVPKFQSDAEWKKGYAGHQVEFFTLKKHEFMEAGQFWLKSPDMRCYDRVVFEPNRPSGLLKGNRLNLWQGLQVKPKPGRWDRLQEHIHEVLVNGDDGGYQYVINWNAWSMQNPGLPPESAIGFQGPEGAGKGTLANMFKPVYGCHWFRLDDSIEGFSGHLHHCVFLFVDEAFVPTDKKAQGRFKGLITEEWMTIEPKYVTKFQVKNLLHIMLASNDDWFLNLGPRARRFSAWEVSSKRLGQFGYFKKLYDQMLHEGGVEAMAHDLLTLDLKGWHPRVIYKNQTLIKQQQRSLRGLDAWIENMLQRGSLPAPLSGKWSNRCYSRDLQAEAGLYNGQTSERAIVETCRDIGLISKDDRVARFNAGHRGWQFLPLPVCRAAWERKMGGDWLWTVPCIAWAAPEDVLDMPVELLVKPFIRRL
jgi:hypothetical protein